jgi:hypothetical protein
MPTYNYWTALTAAVGQWRDGNLELRRVLATARLIRTENR